MCVPSTIRYLVILMTKIFLVLAVLFVAGCDKGLELASHVWTQRCLDAYALHYKVEAKNVYREQALDWCNKNLEFVVKR